MQPNPLAAAGGNVLKICIGCGIVVHVSVLWIRGASAWRTMHNFSGDSLDFVFVWVRCYNFDVDLQGLSFLCCMILANCLMSLITPHTFTERMIFWDQARVPVRWENNFVVCKLGWCCEVWVLLLTLGLAVCDTVVCIMGL
jgi:hypothetical protein